MTKINEENARVKRIFISKNADELVTLPLFCKENNFRLDAVSFLNFEAVSFELHSPFDIVFFASPRAVSFFVDQHKIPLNCQIAVAGETTKKMVEKYGFDVHFCPENGGNVTESARAFSMWVNKRFVLFPTSDLSQKSYSKFLQRDSFQVVTTYKTQISTKFIENQDVYVFTSPSNFKGFVKSNELAESSRVIAWGETTAACMHSYNPNISLSILKCSTEEELILLLKK